MRSWRHSLTVRLVSLFALVTAALLIGLATITLVATDRHFLELDESYLLDKGVLVREIGRHANTADELVQRIRSTLSTQTGLSIELFEGKKAIYRSPNFDLPPEVASKLKHDNPGAIAQWQSNNQQLRGLSVLIPLAGIEHNSPITAILALKTAHHDHFMAAFRHAIWLYVALAILLGGLLGWWVTRKGLTPLRPIIDKASLITASQLSDRISTTAVPSELLPLTETLNQMLQRLEDDFERLSAFSSDLAHELRTPISNMLVQAQVTLSKNREVDQYRETLHSVVEELERLTHMVSDMLYLAKTENHLQIPRPSEVHLGIEAVELAEFYDLLAEEKRVTICVQGQGTVLGDRLMIRRALSNLIANAIRHAHDQTMVTIEINNTGTKTTVSVTNVGDTIAAEIQARLFDRFFRADSARTHPGSEGAGLGLAITQAIMQAHHGAVKLTSGEGKTTFTLAFMLAP
jgi:two-component system heavy metal sensor histidine kinase CusS